jgi:hypothetical protein
VLAHALTRESRYLEALSHNVDWHSGANPLSQTFLTGMGHRHPNRPEISWFLYRDRSDVELFGDTLMGLPIYGIGPPLRNYPGREDDKTTWWPLWRSWNDIWGDRSEIYSEFTIHQTVGPNVMTRAYLYALDAAGGLSRPDARPRYPLGSRRAAGPPGVSTR